MIDKIKKSYNYYKNPKYRIMQGIKIDNRAVMFLGANPIKPLDTSEQLKTFGYIDKEIQEMKISFKNQKFTYWKSKMYCRIWTFKQLIKWARLVGGKGSKVLEYKNNKWIALN